MAYSQYFAGPFSQLTSQACLVDTTPPTFAGIATLTQNADGSLSATWLAATDATPPVRYEVYVQAATATGLFSTANIQQIRNSLSARIFTEVGGNILQIGQTYFVGMRAVDAVGNRDSNTVSSSLTITNANYNTLAGDVWDQSQAAHVGAGTFGLYLDTPVSTRAPAATAVSNADYTSTRAVKIDFLDVLLSTRAPAATALDNTVWTNAKAAFLDVAISSRLASASYTAPDNAGIAAIKAKTDNLPVDPASDTTVLTRAPAATALDNTIWTNAKAAFIDIAISTRAPASTALDNTIWTNAKAAFLDQAISVVAGKVWDELITAHTTPGTFGLVLQTPLSPTQIANAVWDALTSAHTLAGTFGLNAQTPSLNPAQVASAVWDAELVDYNNDGTFGERVQESATGNTGGGSTITQLIAEIDSDSITATVEVSPALEATIEELLL